MKICKKCKEEKSIEEFGNQKTAKDGLKPICKVCNNLRGKEYYKLNKERLWERDIKRKYGATPALYYLLFDQQNGCCAICEKPGKAGGEVND